MWMLPLSYFYLYCCFAPTLRYVSLSFFFILQLSGDLLGFPLLLLCYYYLLCGDFRAKPLHTLNKQVPEDVQLPVCDASFQGLQVVIVQISIPQLKGKQL